MQTYKPEGLGRPYVNYTKDDVIKALQNGEILSGYVMRCDSDLKLLVKLGQNITGEVAFENLEYSPYGEKTKAIAAISKVGKIINFKVTGYSSEGDKMLVQLSRKASMQEAYENFVKNLKPGDVIDARITHIEKYGAFCDVACGLTYLLPIENFCVTRIDNAQEALKGISEIKAVVYGYNKAGKLVLSHRELLGTWDGEASKFSVGSVVVGTVRSVEEYGVFIELTPNLSGLAEATDKVKVGDKVNVLIKNIIPDKMKVKLNILDLDNGKFENDPAIHIDYSGYEIPEHIDSWRYSSEKQTKVVETKF